MQNKFIDKHSKRGYIIYQTRTINNLIENNKIKQAKILINDLIDDYPNDFTLIFSYVRILCFEGRYEEAYTLLTSLEAEERYSFYLTVLAILNHDLKNAEYYYNKYFKEDWEYDPHFKEYDKAVLKIYLQKIFEPHKPVVIDYTLTGSGSYNLIQTINYDEEKAYQYIVNSQNLSKFPNRKLNPSIDVRALMQQLKELIEENKDQSYLNNFRQSYSFYYPHCGKLSDGVDYNLNYLCATTIYNTSDILNIFPTQENETHKSIVVPISSEEKVKELKRISQIDKFNMRYGNK